MPKIKNPTSCPNCSSYRWNKNIKIVGKCFTIKEIAYIKKQVIARDNARCILCNNIGEAVHHINYYKPNNSMNNLVLLCSSCHSHAHRGAKKDIIRMKAEKYIKGRR